MEKSARRKSLGESLVEESIITAEQLKQAQAEEKRSGMKLKDVLVKMDLLTEDDLVSFVSGKLGVPRIELANYLIYPEILNLVPEDLARKYHLIPVLKIGKRLTCAMSDPWNIYAMDELRAKTGMVIEPAVATESEITKALKEHYATEASLEDVLETLDADVAIEKEKTEEDFKKLEAIAEEPTVIKLVNLIIIKAAGEGASDVHLEPEKESLRARFRVDGMLHEIAAPPKHLQAAIISRIKIMANIDIAQRRIRRTEDFS